jgi:hypothetical protein
MKMWGKTTFNTSHFLLNLLKVVLLYSCLVIYGSGCSDECFVNLSGDSGVTFEGDGIVSPMVDGSAIIRGRKIPISRLNLPAFSLSRPEGIWKAFDFSKLNSYKGIKFYFRTPQPNPQYEIGFYSFLTITDQSYVFLPVKNIVPAGSDWQELSFNFQDFYRMDTRLYYPINSIKMNHENKISFFLMRIGKNQPESYFEISPFVLFGRNSRYTIIRPFWNR